MGIWKTGKNHCDVYDDMIFCVNLQMNQNLVVRKCCVVKKTWEHPKTSSSKSNKGAYLLTVVLALRTA